MVVAAVSTSTTPLTSAFLHGLVQLKGGGLCCSTRRSNFTNKEKQCKSKPGSGTIIARIELKPPPYAVNALEPYMSRETLEYHWGKHHKNYVENLNNQIINTELDDLTLESIIMISYNKGSFLPAFNNAAQTWNHEFFWESMKPGGGGKPGGELLRLINRDFGSYESFLDEFKLAASSQFGSGWAWLAYKANRLNVENAVNPRPSEEYKKLVIVKSSNAINPLLWDYSPLLTVDVWEHSYYLDFQNRRTDYISTFMENLVSWEAVSSRLDIAMEKAAEREREEEQWKKEGSSGQKVNNGLKQVYLDKDNKDSESE